MSGQERVWTGHETVQAGQASCYGDQTMEAQNQRLHRWDPLPALNLSYHLSHAIIVVHNQNHRSPSLLIQQTACDARCSACYQHGNERKKLTRMVC